VFLSSSEYFTNPNEAIVFVATLIQPYIQGHLTSCPSLDWSHEWGSMV